MKPSNDIIELSDLFRRSMHFANHGAVAEVVAQARKFVCEVSWIDLTYADGDEINVTTAKHQTQIVSDLVAAAKDAGMSELVLPMHKDSPLAAFVQRQVLDKNDFGMTVRFRATDFKADQNGAGPVNPNIQTALDIGLRGFCAIDSDLKYKWGRQQSGKPSLGIG